MADVPVQFMQIKQSQYDVLATKDSGTLYFCTDTNRIYVGSAKYSLGHPVVLTENTDYGSTLPNSPTTGQLFLQTVSSNFVLDNVYPVGAVYMSMNSTNPGTLFGGTWAQVQGKFLLGVSSSYPAGSSGGETEHTLTQEELPVAAWTSGSGTGGVETSTSGSAGVGYGMRTQCINWGQAHNNMPPYIAVYIWYRTA